MKETPYQPPKGDEHSAETREVEQLPIRPRVGLSSAAFMVAALYFAGDGYVHWVPAISTRQDVPRAIICAAIMALCIAAAYALQIRKPSP